MLVKDIVLIYHYVYIVFNLRISQEKQSYINPD